MSAGPPGAHDGNARGKRVQTAGASPSEASAFLRALLAPPEKLLEQCDQDRFQASGPGGQKRNRVYSGIRLTHRETAVQVTASTHRESRRNLEEALAKLRLELALRAAEDESGHPDVAARLPAFRPKVNPAHADFPPLVYLSLSLLRSRSGRLEAAASSLGLSTSALVRFFRQHPKVWQKAGDLRRESGLGPLK